MKAEIGQDIESLCSKCGESWHVVIAMVEQKIVKVECKQCHAVHRHRDPKAKAAKAKTPRAAAGTARSAGAGKKAGRGAARLRIEADLAKPVRPYSVADSFESGERVQHAKFGEGIVQQSPGPGKIEVLFGDEIKLLAQAKPVSRRFSES